MEISPTAHIRPLFWWVRWVPVALLIAGLIALIIVIGGNVLVPLLMSFALAFMLEPLASALPPSMERASADWQAWEMFSPSRK